MREIKRDKIWEQRFDFGSQSENERIKEIAESLGVSPLFAALLYNRGYTDADSARRFLRFCWRFPVACWYPVWAVILLFPGKASCLVSVPDFSMRSLPSLVVMPSTVVMAPGQ